jgi:hypothetical protein
MAGSTAASTQWNSLPPSWPAEDILDATRVERWIAGAHAACRRVIEFGAQWPAMIAQGLAATPGD